MNSIHVYSNDLIFDENGKLVNIVANVLPSRKADLLNDDMKIAENIIVVGD